MGDFNLTALLDELSTPQYYDRFIQNGFDSWDDVLDITEADMAAMNIMRGHRRRLHRRIQEERLLRRPQSENGKEPVSAPQTKQRRKYMKHPRPDTKAPKRPLSAYALFANDKREDYKGYHLSFVDLAKEIGRQWQVLDGDTRNEYHAGALRAKQRYQVLDAQYSQSEECEQYRKYMEDWKVRQSAKIQTHNDKRNSEASYSRSKQPSTPSTVSSQMQSPATESGNASTLTTTSTTFTTSPTSSDAWSVAAVQDIWNPRFDEMTALQEPLQGQYYGLPAYDIPYDLSPSVQYTFLPPFAPPGIDSQGHSK